MMRQSISRLIFLALLAFAAFGVATHPATAGGRLALVIGNAKYETAPVLANPSNDADDLAKKLRTLGFDVVEARDASRAAMADAVRQFSGRIRNAELALFFYAGHGLQMAGENYLVPVDARIETEADVRFSTINLADIQQEMEGPGRANIIILDACRDNPFADKLAHSGRGLVSRGLGKTEATGVGSLIVFSTKPNSIAMDGVGRNSPFMAALLKYVDAPGLEVRQMLSRVRGDVLAATEQQQQPWDDSSLVGDVYLAGSAATPTAEAVKAEPPKPDATHQQTASASAPSGSETLARSGAGGGRYLDAKFCSDQLNLNPGGGANGGACQLWRLVPESDGWSRLQLKFNGKFLDAKSCGDSLDLNPGSTEDGGSCQLWKFAPDADGWSRLQLERTGKYLSSGNCLDSVILQDASPANGGACQLWRLVPADNGWSRLQMKYASDAPAGVAQQVAGAVPPHVAAANAAAEASGPAADCERMAAPAPPFASPDQIKAAGTKDYSAAIEPCQHAAEVDPNNPRLQYLLARAYYLGPKNYIEAVRHYRIAVDAGYAPAEDALGVIFATGKGVVKDPQRAFDLFNKSALAGDPSGMSDLGVAYANGVFVKADPAQALAWYEKGIEAGNAFSLNNVGVAYFNGAGTERDYNVAAQYFQQAADMNFGYALKFLAIMYERGLLGKPDPAKAAELRLKAAQVDPTSDDPVVPPQQAAPPRPAHNVVHRYVRIYRYRFFGCSWIWC
jgi:uncharacterized caspase-like protein/TPR repeat protein